MARIMLVNDDTKCRNSEVEVLQRFGGYGDFVEVGDGTEAVAYFSDGTRPRPDLVLMDLHMPTMDGDEATRKIRENGYDGPIVILTSDPVALERLKKADTGATDARDRYMHLGDFLQLVRSFVPDDAAPTPEK